MTHQLEWAMGCRQVQAPKAIQLSGRLHLPSHQAQAKKRKKKKATLQRAIQKPSVSLYALSFIPATSCLRPRLFYFSKYLALRDTIECNLHGIEWNAESFFPPFCQEVGIQMKLWEKQKRSRREVIWQHLLHKASTTHHTVVSVTAPVASAVAAPPTGTFGYNSIACFYLSARISAPGDSSLSASLQCICQATVRTPRWPIYFLCQPLG